MLERSVLFPTVPVGSPPPPVSYRGYRYCTLSARVATGPRLQWPLAVGGRLSTGHPSSITEYEAAASVAVKTVILVCENVTGDKRFTLF